MGHVFPPKFTRPCNCRILVTSIAAASAGSVPLPKPRPAEGASNTIGSNSANSCITGERPGSRIAATQTLSASPADLSALKEAITAARRSNIPHASELQSTISDPLAGQTSWSGAFCATMRAGQSSLRVTPLSFFKTRAGLPSASCAGARRRRCGRIGRTRESCVPSLGNSSLPPRKESSRWPAHCCCRVRGAQRNRSCVTRGTTTLSPMILKLPRSTFSAT